MPERFCGLGLTQGRKRLKMFKGFRAPGFNASLRARMLLGEWLNIPERLQHLVQKGVYVMYVRMYVYLYVCR